RMTIHIVASEQDHRLFRQDCIAKITVWVLYCTNSAAGECERSREIFGTPRRVWIAVPARRGGKRRGRWSPVGQPVTSCLLQRCPSCVRRRRPVGPSRARRGLAAS